MFSAGQARRDARRFRRRGLDETARRLVDGISDRGIDDATVLEVGGGVGGIQIELLRSGAAGATCVELSHGYEEEAQGLLAEAGFEGRVDRRVGDFVDEAPGLEAADVVVLHRVVCCYPDEEALVGAAADRTRRLLAMSFPRDRLWIRAAIRCANVVFRLIWGFEMYVRPVATVVAPAEARGLSLVREHQGAFWRFIVLER